MLESLRTGRVGYEYSSTLFLILIKSETVVNYVGEFILCSIALCLIFYSIIVDDLN